MHPLVCSLVNHHVVANKEWWWISSTCIWLVLIAGCAVKRMYHCFMNDHFGSQHGLEQLIGRLHLTFAKVELPALTVLEGLKSRMLYGR